MEARRCGFFFYLSLVKADLDNAIIIMDFAAEAEQSQITILGREWFENSLTAQSRLLIKNMLI